MRRIARELEVSKNTVKRYLRQGGWGGYARAARAGALAAHGAWLAERFRRHAGAASVVRQELQSELGVAVSLRTVERACAPLRRELAAAARATVRFETAPGQQMQIDFGTRRVDIGGELERVSVFVATLGYSRRCYVQAFDHERQSAWFDGVEGAFRHFGGVPEEVLLDNARALVAHHDPQTREVQFNERLHAFAAYWGFRPRACAPYRARYRKAKTSAWSATSRATPWPGAVSPLGRTWRATSTAGCARSPTCGCMPALIERPLDRFLAEAAALRPLPERPPFRVGRSLLRRVHSDACIEIDGNRYSVPWRLIGAEVRAEVTDAALRILHGTAEVACHQVLVGCRGRALDPAHLAGVVAAAQCAPAPAGAPAQPALPAPPALLRPLSEYAELAGGAG